MRGGWASVGRVVSLRVCVVRGCRLCDSHDRPDPGCTCGRTAQDKTALRNMSSSVGFVCVFCVRFFYHVCVCVCVCVYIYVQGKKGDIYDEGLLSGRCAESKG